jgi:hypothetical protein
MCIHTSPESESKFSDPVVLILKQSKISNGWLFLTTILSSTTLQITTTYIPPYKMHLTMLALFAMAALVATAQPHARRDPTDLGYFSCDTAADTAVCSELADSTEASLETGNIECLMRISELR